MITQTWARLQKRKAECRARWAFIVGGVVMAALLGLSFVPTATKRLRRRRAPS